jgi:hypothetical protein
VQRARRFAPHRTTPGAGRVTVVRARRLVALLGVAGAWAAGDLIAPGAGGDAPSPERLPDLEQELPDKLQVVRSGARGRPRWRLAFWSAVRNVGDGPLILLGERPDRRRPGMTAAQLIEREGAPQARIEEVGELRFVRSHDHEHWHLLGFERYELRRAGRRAALVRDRKTGFCLGDRYRASGPDLPAAPPEPVYTGRCGLGQPQRLRLVQGISVGYGDDYEPLLEGQSLRLTGLAAGRYALVHRVNVGRRLRETSYGNNASSLLLRLRWERGRPRVRVLARCPDSASCG